MFDNETGQNGLTDSLIPTPPPYIHLTDIPEDAAAPALLPPPYTPFGMQEAKLDVTVSPRPTQAAANKSTPARGRGKR
jgi:hypothetical protein